MAKVLSKEEWKKRKKLYAYLKLVVAAMLALLIVLILLIGLIKVVKNLFSKGSPEAPVAPTMKQELDITELFLTPNGYTTPAPFMIRNRGLYVLVILHAVIRRFLSNMDIMRMALAQCRRCNLNKFSGFF